MYCYHNQKIYIYFLSASYTVVFPTTIYLLFHTVYSSSIQNLSYTELRNSAHKTKTICIGFRLVNSFI